MFPKRKKAKQIYNKIVVNHQIFLTSKQRNDLYMCHPLDVVGLLTQYKIEEGKYPIKHQEVICRYHLLAKTEVEEYVECFPTFYRINLPAITDDADLFAGSAIDLRDMLDKKQGGKEGLFFEAMYTDKAKNLQGFHKIEIRDFKHFQKSMCFTKI